MRRTFSRRQTLALLGTVGLGGCNLLEEEQTPSFEDGPAEWSGDPPSIPDDAWPMEQRTAGRTASMPTATLTDPPTEKAWEVPLDESVDRYFVRPVVRNGTVFYSSLGEGGSIVALDAADGTEQWRWDRATVPPLACADDTLFSLTSDDDPNATGGVTAWDIATGTRQWHYTVPNLDRTLVLTDGAVLTGTTGSDVLALDQESGELIWRFDPGGAQYRTQNLAVAGDVYFTTSAPAAGDNDISGFVNAVDPAAGELSWSVKFDDGTPEIAVAEETVVVVSEGEVAALDSKSGSKRWWNSMGGSGMAISDDSVVVSTGSGAVAYDLQSGRRRWGIPDALTAPVGGDTVYAHTIDRLDAYDLQTGDQSWSASIPLGNVHMPRIAEGRLYTVTDRLIAWQ